MTLKAQFLGHACWLLDSDDHRIIIDPFLEGNPTAAASPQELEVDYILVTHAHGDHLGDAVTLAKSNGAVVISTFEVANLVAEKGVESHGMHIGGTHQFDFGLVRVVPAFHGSGVPGGHACGFVVSTPGGTVYHAGDTSIFGDMKLLNGVIVDRIDLAFLPIGSNFTMGIDDAVIATEWINPDVVIPMHYNTFPVIEANPEEFREKVESRLATRVVVLQPGEEFTLEQE